MAGLLHARTRPGRTSRARRTVPERWRSELPGKTEQQKKERWKRKRLSEKEEEPRQREGWSMGTAALAQLAGHRSVPRALVSRRSKTRPRPAQRSAAHDPRALQVRNARMDGAASAAASSACNCMRPVHASSACYPYFPRRAGIATRLVQELKTETCGWQIIS